MWDGFFGDQRKGRLREAAGSAVVGGNQGGDEEPAEDALVHEPQLCRHAARWG